MTEPVINELPVHIFHISQRGGTEITVDVCWRCYLGAAVWDDLHRPLRRSKIAKQLFCRDCAAILRERLR